MITTITRCRGVVRYGCAFIFAFLTSLPQAGAVEILGTDFADRTIDFEVASDINWRTSGVVAPGDLTVVDSDDTGLLAGLFDTDGTFDAFVPDMNIHNEGPWHVDVPIEVLDQEISLVRLDLGLGIFSNGGTLQASNRDADVVVTIFDSEGTEISSGEGLDTYSNEGPVAENPTLVSIMLSAVTLVANEEYTMRVAVSGEGPGNNAGFDSLSLEGVIGGAAADPLIASSAATIALGRLPAFPAANAFSFTITNNGANETLLISTIEINGETPENFTIASFPASLDPGESGEVVGQFDSMGESASFSAELVVASNSVIQDELIVNVSATVDAPDGDSDGDGLTDEGEAAAGTDPFVTDSDLDGLTDGDEVNIHKTMPTVADSDGDGFPDGAEISSGTDPNDANSKPARVLFTGFIDRVIDELTASEFAWVTDGIADPGPLMAVDTDDTGILFELFDTDDAMDAFVPDMNIHNEGPWHVDVPLNVTASSLNINQVVLGLGIYNNGGALQAVSRNVNLAVTIFEGDTEIATGEALEVFAADGPYDSNPVDVSIALSDAPLILSEGTYVMRIAVSGEGAGNNAGLTSISIEGGTSGGSGLGFSITDLSFKRAGEEDITVIQWRSIPGVSYALDSSANLETWIEEQDGLPAEAAVTTYEFLTPVEPVLYFRIRQE